MTGSWRQISAHEPIDCLLSRQAQRPQASADASRCRLLTWQQAMLVDLWLACPIVLQCRQPCMTRSTGWVSRSVSHSSLCLLTYKCLHGLAPDYLSRFCKLLTSVPGRPLLRSADANKLLVPRSCTASFGPCSFSSSGLTAWNDMPAHLRNLDLTLSDFRQLLKTTLFQTFVTVNLLIERFEMPVYYYYYI